MLAHVWSDVHLEHHHDGGEEFLGEFAYPGVGLVFLAGDICAAPDLMRVVPLFHAIYPNARLAYVAGNHEYYGRQARSTERCLRAAEEKFAAYFWRATPGRELYVAAANRRVVGATMWFPAGYDPRLEPGLNDFRYIGGFDPCEWNREWVEWYAANGTPGDIVITHHAPSRRSASPRFARDPLNCFFASDMEELIKRNRPAFWIHGHMHSPCDYVLGNTRVVCHAAGYPWEVPWGWAPKEVEICVRKRDAVCSSSS